MLAVVGEDGLVAELFVFWVEHGPGPVGLAIVFELEGVAAYEDFGGPDKAAEGLLIVFHHVQIHLVGGVAGHDHEHRNGAPIQSCTT